MKHFIFFLLLIFLVSCHQKPKNITEAVNIAIENEEKNGKFLPQDLQNITSLIKNGDNPAIRENKNEHFSPLIYALNHPKSDILQAMLNGGFDPNFEFVYPELGGTRVPMIFETINDISHENFKLLIRKGVSVNSKVERENKILILETASIAPKNTLFLLENGADFQVKNRNGQSVADLVQSNIQSFEKPISAEDLQKIYPNITEQQIENQIIREKEILKEWQKVKAFLEQKGVIFSAETDR